MVLHADGPHMDSLLTLPRHFSGVCKGLQSQNQLSLSTVKSDARIKRPSRQEPPSLDVIQYREVCIDKPWGAGLTVWDRLTLALFLTAI